MNFLSLTRSVLLVTLCAFMSGCAVTSKTCSELTKNMNERITTLRTLQSDIEHNPDAAIARYNEYLKREEGFAQPLSVYQEDLRQGIQQLETSPTAVLSIDSISGFPYYYNKRLGAIVRSHIGLARAYVAKNNIEEAERHLIRAIDVVNRHGTGSYRLKQYQADAHRMLMDIYTRQGRTGKALVSRLNMELTEDYLKSEDGVRSYYLEKGSYFEAHERFAEIDKFVEHINQKRVAEADRQMREIMGALTQVASTMAHAQMDSAMSRNTGFSGPDMRTMQMNRMMIDMTMKIVSAASGGPNLAQEQALNPMANTTFVGQLMDRRKGSRTFEIIKAFVNAAADMSNDDSIKRTSKEIIGLLESVNVSRRSDSSEKMLNDVSSLANVLSLFQKKVQGVGDNEVK